MLLNTQNILKTTDMLIMLIACLLLLNNLNCKEAYTIIEQVKE